MTRSNLGCLGVVGAVLTATAIAFGQTPQGGVPEQSKFINEYFAKIWKENKLKPSDRSSNYEFVRRVYLDLIGRIPRQDLSRAKNSDEVAQFVSRGANRAELINKLLTDRVYTEEYARHMADLWSVWLLTRSGNPIYREQMKLWLEDNFARNTSYKEMVQELITAKGKTVDNGAVNFILAHLGDRTPRDKVKDEGHFEVVPVTSRTTRLFLGLQTQCVQCHDHPFNPEFKQSAFWGVNVFYRQVDRAGNPIMRQLGNRMDAAILELKDDGQVNPLGVINYERRNAMILPTTMTFVDGRKVDASPSKSRREQLAELIVTHDNFAKSIVNRVWGQLFGRGLHEQPAVDDFGDHNKLIHPELLDKLARDFTYANYDLRQLYSWICNSDVYQLSSVANNTNDKPETDVFFSRMQLKNLSPEQLLESLLVATQGKSANADSKESEKRREEWNRRLVSNFGDDEGNEVNFNGTVIQALLMMNGKEINKELLNPQGLIADIIKTRKGNFGPIINDIYMAALSRPMAGNESGIIRRVADKFGGKVDQTFYADVMWALLNSNEFILNH